MIRAALIALVLSGGAVAAEPSATQAAQQAAERLEQATRALNNAQDAQDRIAALTETLRGFEDGLEAMRTGLRKASIRERQLSRDLAARDEEVAQLLGVLLTMGHDPAPVSILHPAGPVGTARSGMILAEVTPALNARAADLRDSLREVATLRLLQESAVETLEKGLQTAQEARATLSQAISDRTDLPRRFAADPVKTGILIASTETLAGFASGLSEIGDGGDAPADEALEARKGTLRLPVQGRILHRAGETDASGVTRPGLVLATRPRALVTTPAAATVRYAGPLLDYGNVIILEPQAGTLFVLAGLDVVYGETGQVLPEDSPLGLMPGQDAEIGAIVPQSGDGAGNDNTETLYIEVRQDDSPVDPEDWFQTQEG
ncbi:MULTISPECIES: murein hydrolase activator EnvC family protein [Sediminimonas]|uniref:murein hydrolase activator EnvC family protein n=1 Tax=Sediminimonas TaxID=659427 RepID=UPI00040A97C1|nr:MULTISPECIES: peptidoglycan DD-metalloendopeptidase family protein [Sediminimonas]MDR9486003.1 peptidoglycan DD-metalloendopeptidase family protein [Sediminimonas sp.]